MARPRDLRAAGRSRARASIVLNNLGMFAYFDGRWDDAITLYRRSREMRRTRRHARPTSPSPTATSARSCPTRATSTRPRSTCSARAGCGAERGERQSVAFIDLLLATARDAARRRPSGGADARGGDERAPRVQHGCLRRFRPGADRRGRGARRRLRSGRSRSRTISSTVTDRNAPLLERVAGIALARLGYTDAARAELIAALGRARAWRGVRHRGDDRRARRTRRRGRGPAPRAGRDPEPAEDRSPADAGLRLSGGARRVRSRYEPPQGSPLVCVGTRTLRITSTPVRAVLVLDARDACDAWSA